MKRITLFLSALFLFSCHPSDKNNVEKDDSYLLDIKKWNHEHLAIDSMMIDGRVPLIATKTQLFALLGKPDTIILVPPDFSNTPGTKSEMVYFKDLRYVIVGENAFIQSINFENSNLTVTHPKTTLDKNTTVKDVQKMFPQSGRIIRGGGTTFDGFMQLRSSKEWSDINVWFLIFKRTKLVRLDLIHAF